MEARTLTALVEAALPRAWRRGSPWHGDSHWRCVTTTGLALGTELGDIDRALVFCFGLLHDTRRENETYDPGHGPRAEAFARELRAEALLDLDDGRFESLGEALRLHSHGQVSADPTIGTCWDADRLHLPRVSIEPDPTLFSTHAAHGPARLSAAAVLREHGAPGWDTLVASAAAG
jgi:uncharacterized protein